MFKSDMLSGRRAICLMVSILLVMGVAGWALLKWVFPEYYFSAYPLIPLTFMIFAVVIVLLAVRWEKGVAIGRTTQQRVIINLSAVKIGKLLVSAILLLLYWKLWDEHTDEFFLVFLIFYTVFLVMETIIFINFTKKYSRKNKSVKK